MKDFPQHVLGFKFAAGLREQAHTQLLALIQANQITAATIAYAYTRRFNRRAVIGFDADGTFHIYRRLRVALRQCAIVMTLPPSHPLDKEPADTTDYISPFMRRD